MRNPFRYFNSSPEVIRLTVMMYIRYPLSLRQVEDILFERGIDICHETIRLWWSRFGPMFANELPILTRPANENGPDDNRIPIGKRGDILFHFALDQARFVDTLSDLLDVVSTQNMNCEEPLSQTEVRKIASSAWGYESRGENLKGRGGSVVISNCVLDALIDDPDAWCLYGKLKRHHWGRDFALAKPMAASMDWTLRRWKKARAKLVAVGVIRCIHRGGSGPGDPPLYRLRGAISHPNKKLDTPLPCTTVSKQSDDTEPVLNR